MVEIGEGVIEYLRDRDKVERNEKKMYGSKVVRLDIYIGSPSQYPKMADMFHAIATKLSAIHAAGREADFDDRDIATLARQMLHAKRQEFAEMEPGYTIKRANVPNSEYRKK